jgi:hypothetical protein
MLQSSWGEHVVLKILIHSYLPWINPDSLYIGLTGGYYFLNPENVHGLYEMLVDNLGIRIARENTVIPNIELKFVKDDFDRYSLDNKLRVIMGENQVFISPIELQIPYKLYLGSDKDIEDAVYLWDIFKGKINNRLLKTYMRALHVRGDPYGIEI